MTTTSHSPSPHPKPRVLLALQSNLYRTMFSPADVARLAELAVIINPEPEAVVTTDFLSRNIGDAQFAITSWESPRFDEHVVHRARALHTVCHAGGSVRAIVSDAFWQNQLRITSAAAAISYGVAEYCLGLILIASKRAFWLGIETRHGHWKDAGTLFGGWHEIYQQKIGIIGAGFVGRQLVALLRNFTCNVLMYDPYLSEEASRELGVTKVNTLEQLFEECRVVSLNAPSTPETQGMLRGSHFARLREGGLFINTARSALVNEAEFLEELRTGRFVACIDVTNQEPPALDHPFRSLPNVWLTPHVAGAVAENQLRIGTMVVDEFERYTRGEPYRFEITAEQLKNMA